jgi:arsenate reductase-like glutaredoxin family protein
MLQYPAIIRRPILDLGTTRTLGFSAARFAALFS